MYLDLICPSLTYPNHITALRVLPPASIAPSYTSSSSYPIANGARTFEQLNRHTSSSCWRGRRSAWRPPACAVQRAQALEVPALTSKLTQGLNERRGKDEGKMRWSGTERRQARMYSRPSAHYSASATRLVKITKHEVWRDDNEQDNLPKVSGRACGLCFSSRPSQLSSLPSSLPSSLSSSLFCWSIRRALFVPHPRRIRSPLLSPYLPPLRSPPFLPSFHLFICR